MLQLETASSPAGAPHPGLRLFRPESPYVALGLAVSHLMTKPAFANLRFGDWSRVLVGQINRKHYAFVVDDKNQIQGFLGWALTSKEKAEAWVEGCGELSYQDSLDGDPVIFNAAAGRPMHGSYAPPVAFWQSRQWQLPINIASALTS